MSKLGAGFAVPSQNTAILVVDVFPQGLHAFSRDEAKEIVRKVDEFLDSTEVRPIFLETMYSSFDIDDAAWDASAKGIDLYEGLRLKNRPVWGQDGYKFEFKETKRHNSGFEMTGLADFLKRNGVTAVAVLGVEQPLCAWDTARDGPKNSLKTSFLGDLTWTSPSVARGMAERGAAPITPELAKANDIDWVTVSEFLARNPRIAIKAESALAQAGAALPSPFLAEGLALK